MVGLAVGNRFAMMAYALSALLAFLASAFLAYNYDFEVTIDRAEHVKAAGIQYIPSFQVEPGPQLVMVYVGSSTCPWSNAAGLPDAIERIKGSLADRAALDGMSFKAVGLAIDWSPDRGVEHLRQFGLFDEISAGYNWASTLALRYLWSDDADIASTPAVIVYTRTFVGPQDPEGPLHYGEDARRFLRTVRGAEGISEWAALGAPLDVRS